MSDLLLRDGAMTAAVLGFFASAWFGWAQERPPAGWKAPLAAGSVLGLATALAGGLVAWRSWDSGSVLDDAAAFRTYLVIVGIEFGVAAIGAAVLLLLRRAGHLAPWICLVVGMHFYPMAPVLENADLYLLGTLLTAVALVSPVVAARRELPASAVTGAGAGPLLLVFALGSGAGLVL